MNNPSIILEPSVGQGHLVEYIKAKKPNINFDLYEIDEKISFLDSIKKEAIKFGDFLEFNIVLYKTSRFKMLNLGYSWIILDSFF